MHNFFYEQLEVYGTHADWCVTTSHEKNVHRYLWHAPRIEYLLPIFEISIYQNAGW